MTAVDADYVLDDVMRTYRLDGTMAREKARVLVEGPWMDRVYHAIMDPELPRSTLLAIGQTLIKLGDLEPKKDAPAAQAGPGFSITINIPQQDGKPPITIKGTSQAIDADAEEDLIEGTPPMLALQFGGNEDLIGGPL
jgi:hypothetical protein